MTLDKIKECISQNGFFMSCSKDVDEVVSIAIEQGWLIKAKKEWFLPDFSADIYVSSHVKNKGTMPASLHKVLFPKEPIKKGDMVSILLKNSFGNEVTCLGKVEKAPFQNKKEETLVEVSVDHGCFLCKIEEIVSWWSLQ